MRCAAFALTIHSRCSFNDAPISPCRAVARGLVRDGVALARKRTSQSIFRMAQAGSQRSVPVGHVSWQRAPERWLVERQHRATAEYAGVAIRGLAARLSPIDEDDR